MWLCGRKLDVKLYTAFRDKDLSILASQGVERVSFLAGIRDHGLGQNLFKFTIPDPGLLLTRRFSVLPARIRYSDSERVCTDSRRGSTDSKFLF